ncbi:MAG: hypothetical protein LBR86_02700 [Tannerella sp.]|jgi:hypothetical protein|nr:hypothetical protein [Tannerella sp.]
MPPVFDQEVVDRAVENGKQANEGYERSLKFVEGWLTTADSISGLLPNLVSDMFNNSEGTGRWEPHNTAADNYPFMVLTAYLLDKPLYDGRMKEILQAEKKLTSRVKSLPDIYSFSKRGFRYDELNMGQVVFGTSEYIKDGLIPLNEYLGKSPWQERMFEMLDDLEEYIKDPADVEKLYGRPDAKTSEIAHYRALIEEVNGDMLQTLSRVYRITGDKKYLDWAVRIGDYYLLGKRDLSQVEYLRLRDHGCEVIGGLSELYVTLHYADSEKKRQYSEAFYRLLDRVLETGRNEDGIFYNAINPGTGKVVDSGLVDNWGYIFDAYYSVYLVDNKEEYRQAVLKGVGKLYEKYRNYPWEGKSHDGYADALESGITIYNREPVAALKSWIDSEMKVMFAMQRPDGIIGGWHGDGNFARTAIMYSLWKSQGATVQPWRSDVMLGAERSGDEIYFTLTAGNGWEGKLLFDAPRHKTILHLPIDYPRINQFPEWFTASENETYRVVSSQQGLSGSYSGAQLQAGIPVKIEAGGKIVLSLGRL